VNQNKLFQLTRWRLATWYAGVMGVILGLCGLGVYEAIAHAHRITINRELESVAGTLHDSLEPVLKQPAKLEPEAIRLLPDVCQVGTDCSNIANSQRHAAGAIHQGNYYMRLLDRSGRLVAVAGVQPGNLPLTPIEQQWQNLTNDVGINYRQITFTLHTQDYQDWGYIQVGRSLQDVENYVATVRWFLILGLPGMMLLVAGSSWWLAGLAMQPIYKSYHQIQQFTADAAHELRTPLAAIRATVESTLMMPTLSEVEARDTLQTTRRQNQRLSQLVEDLLMLCRMDQLTASSPPKLKGERVCLNDLVSDVAEELAALALATDVMLTSQMQVSSPLEVTGDVEQLYRLLSNLASNAIHYTPAGGKVILVLELSPHDALIHIQDTGIGISVPEQKRIFDRFYRVNSDRSRHTGGSGLGLSIANAIALAHYGSISVESEPGKGSRFTVRLPLKEV
jgi:signal transduction histidine kinase